MSVEDRLRTGLDSQANSWAPPVESSLAEVHSRVRIRRRRVLVSWVAAAAPVAAIAGAAVSLGGGRDAAPSPSTASDTRLVGTFQAEVAVPVLLHGKWSLAFAGDGTLMVTAPETYPGVLSGSLFSADSTTVRTNLFAQDVCSSMPTPSYTWRWVDAEVVFTVVADVCAARRQFFTENQWEVSTEAAGRG